MNFIVISDRQLYGMCQRYGLNAKLWLRKFAGLLPEVWRRELWKKFGFHSLGEFASKLAGMGEETVKKILRLDQQFVDKPLLREQLVSGSQGWSKLQTVANIARPDTDRFWSEKVQKMSKPALEKFVTAYRQSSPGGEQNAMEEEDSQVVVMMHLNSKLATRLYLLKQRLEKERHELVNWNTVMATLLDEGEAPLPAEEIHQIKSEVSKEMPDEATSRHIPAKVERVLKMEFGGTCAFPGCVKAAEVRHHTKRFSLARNHKPENIVPLCKLHHTLAHHGVIGNEELDPSQWYLKKDVDKNSPKHRIDLKVQAHMRGS